jgi:DNA invertase Pin-like site-specific DNA recombinase
MKLPLYTRKSSEDKFRQVLSCEEQRDEFARARPEVEIVYIPPEHMSAHHPGRPLFNDLLDDIQVGKYDGLAAYSPDRLARNELDAARISYMVRTGKIKNLVFATYTFENNPEGIRQLQSLLTDSQFYSSNLSRNVKRGNRKHVETGHLNGVPPGGYTNARDPENRALGIIVKDEEHWSMRRRMWDLMLSGLHSVPSVQRIVTEEGYQTRGSKRHPSGPISVTGLYLMFRNIRYAGLIPVPGETGKLVKAKYPSMVTLDEFRRVQELLGGRPFRRSPEVPSFAYRGAISCGECGAQITAEKKVRHYKNGNTQTFVYYHCTGKRPCSQSHKNTREEELERQFGDLLSKYTILPQFRDWALEVLASQNEAIDTSTVLVTQDQALEALHAEVKGLIRMGAQGLISGDEFKSSKADLENQIAQIQKERDETERRATNWYEESERLFDLAVHGREHFIAGDIDVKREVLAGIGSNLTLLGGTLRFSPHPWLVPIENGYQDLEAEYEKVRTQDFASIEEKTAAYANVYNSWLGIVNEVRTLLMGVYQVTQEDSSGNRRPS